MGIERPATSPHTRTSRPARTCWRGSPRPPPCSTRHAMRCSGGF